ncbi:uncharacterized protein [Dysidea avara]|uniref:uncharacterized protein n=1 Tax=Dysidea avara TaxID=196820 RepID=UPI0033218247
MNTAHGKLQAILVLLYITIARSDVVSEGGVPAQQVQFSVSLIYTDMESDDGTRYGVVSEHTMIILPSNGTLTLLETHGNAGSSRILATTHLEKRPDELRYFELEGSVYITAVYWNSLPEACAYTHRLGRKIRHKCTTPLRILKLQHQMQDPKTLNVPDEFAVSLYIDDEQRPYVFMVIFDQDYGVLWSYNLLNGRFEDSYELPANCTCHPSNCFTDVNNTKGQVVINCASGDQYLHQIDSGDFFVIGPAPVQQVTVSNTAGQPQLAVMTKHWDELNQDVLIVSNITNERGYAKSLPITSFPASPTDKQLLPDGAVIIPVNESDLEIVCFHEPGKNEISSFVLLNDLNIRPIPMSTSIPGDLVNISTITGLRGTPNLLAAEVTSFNNNKYILRFAAELVTNPDLETIASPKTTASPSHSVPTVYYKSGASVSQGTSTRASTSSNQGTSSPPTDAVTGDTTTSVPPTTVPELNASTPTVDTSKASETSLSDCKVHISFAVAATAGLALCIGIVLSCCVYCRSQTRHNKRYLTVRN